MKTLSTLLLCICVTAAYAQTTEIIIENKSTAGVVLPKRINKTVKNENTYNIKLTKVNSANIILKVQAKSMELYTAFPDLLKPVLPGVAGSIPKFDSNKWSSLESFDYDEELRNLNTVLARLKPIKTEADKLYKATPYTPNTSTADAAFAEVKKLYAAANLTDLNTDILSDIQFLNSFRDVVEGIIKNQSEINPKFIKFYASLVAIANELKKVDYYSLFEYIQKSQSAKDYVLSKPFTPTKDLMELKFLIIDTYKKDTLVNDMRTLYSNGGGIGLSFSTGFFYTEMLGDQPYYLVKQPDNTMLIQKDRRTVSDVSIGAMGHIYFKPTSNFRIGPSIGLSLSPFDGKTRYLLGGSMLFGNEKMFGINIGSAWAKIKQVSALATGKEPALYLPAGTSTVPTFDKIQNTWFIGLTYNIISTRK
ncbi:MAG: hypothetical protein V4663_16765 [Bacteroidota bacterium]